MQTCNMMLTSSTRKEGHETVNADSDIVELAKSYGVETRSSYAGAASVMA